MDKKMQPIDFIYWLENVLNNGDIAESKISTIRKHLRYVFYGEQPDYSRHDDEFKADLKRYADELAAFKKRQNEPIEWDLTLPCDEELVPFNPPTFDTAFLF
jgi:hypothetical protein